MSAEEKKERKGVCVGGRNGHEAEEARGSAFIAQAIPSARTKGLENLVVIRRGAVVVQRVGGSKPAFGMEAVGVGEVERGEECGAQWEGDVGLSSIRSAHGN